MTPNENKALYRTYYEEVLNRANYGAIDELVDKNVVSHSPLPGQKPGSVGLRDTMQLFHAAFPDLHAKAEDMIAEGDKVVGRFIVTGTHQGEFMGMPATGKKITYEEIVIVRFKNGKIVEHWAVADALTLMQQLGAVQF